VRIPLRVDDTANKHHARGQWKTEETGPSNN